MSDVPFWGPDFAALTEQDPEIAGVVLGELERLRTGLQLIASENFTSPAVLRAWETSSYAPACVTAIVRPLAVTEPSPSSTAQTPPASYGPEYGPSTSPVCCVSCAPGASSGRSGSSSGSSISSSSWMARSVSS